ncbi:MAG: putative toxin-antitoxin system toxin component, PIN family, partial [Chloroflexota bacterium]
YLPWCDVVEDTSNPPATPACRDPADIPFLQLALVGRADFLVMGDRDILAVSASYPRSIISGAQLLSALEDYS